MIVTATVADQILLVPIMVALLLCPIFLTGTALNNAEKSKKPLDAEQRPIFIVLTIISLVGSGAIAYLARDHYGTAPLVIYGIFALLCGLGSILLLYLALKGVDSEPQKS